MADLIFTLRRKKGIFHATFRYGKAQHQIISLKTKDRAVASIRANKLCDSFEIHRILNSPEEVV